MRQREAATSGNTLQHAATDCKTLQPTWRADRAGGAVGAVIAVETGAIGEHVAAVAREGFVGASIAGGLGNRGNVRGIFAANTHGAHSVGM